MNIRSDQQIKRNQKSLRKVCYWIVIPLLISGLFVAYVSNTELSPEATTNFHEQCQRYNYTTEEYEVITEDGYILSLFRIPGKGPPVLLLHGLFNSANTFTNFKFQFTKHFWMKNNR